MLPTVPTTLSTETDATLKELHGRLQTLGHNLAWFIDRSGRARLLVTLETARETISYRAGDEVHAVTVATDRHTADLDLSQMTVRMLGVDGLLAYIEKQTGMAIAPDLDTPMRRVA